MSEWDAQLYEYMVANQGGQGSNYCLSAAIGGWDFTGGNADVPAGQTWWAAASAEGAGSDAAWAATYSADQERPIMQEDGTEKQVNIIEFKTIVDACMCDLKKNGPPANGVWIGGNKHSIVRKDVNNGDQGDCSFLVVTTARPGEKGHVIICTDPEASGKGVLITAEYDKQKGCTASMAIGVALEFGKWCKDNNVDHGV